MARRTLRQKPSLFYCRSARSTRVRSIDQGSAERHQIWCAGGANWARWSMPPIDRRAAFRAVTPPAKQAASNRPLSNPPPQRGGPVLNVANSPVFICRPAIALSKEWRREQRGRAAARTELVTGWSPAVLGYCRGNLAYGWQMGRFEGHIEFWRSKLGADDADVGVATDLRCSPARSAELTWSCRLRASR